MIRQVLKGGKAADADGNRAADAEARRAAGFDVDQAIPLPLRPEKSVPWLDPPPGPWTVDRAYAYFD